MERQSQNLMGSANSHLLGVAVWVSLYAVLAASPALATVTIGTIDQSYTYSEDVVIYNSNGYVSMTVYAATITSNGGSITVASPIRGYGADGADGAPGDSENPATAGANGGGGKSLTLRTMPSGGFGYGGSITINDVDIDLYGGRGGKGGDAYPTSQSLTVPQTGPAGGTGGGGGQFYVYSVGSITVDAGARVNVDGGAGGTGGKGGTVGYFDPDGSLVHAGNGGQGGTGGNGGYIYLQFANGVGTNHYIYINGSSQTSNFFGASGGNGGHGGAAGSGSSSGGGGRGGDGGTAGTGGSGGQINIYACYVRIPYGASGGCTIRARSGFMGVPGAGGASGTAYSHANPNWAVYNEYTDQGGNGGLRVGQPTGGQVTITGTDIIASAAIDVRGTGDSSNVSGSGGHGGTFYDWVNQQQVPSYYDGGAGANGVPGGTGGTITVNAQDPDMGVVSLTYSTLITDGGDGAAGGTGGGSTNPESGGAGGAGGAGGYGGYIYFEHGTFDLSSTVFGDGQNVMKGGDGGDGADAGTPWNDYYGGAGGLYGVAGQVQFVDASYTNYSAPTRQNGTSGANGSP